MDLYSNYKTRLELGLYLWALNSKADVRFEVLMTASMNTAALYTLVPLQQW
jgi:hypothetical protein